VRGRADEADGALLDVGERRSCCDLLKRCKLVDEENRRGLGPAARAARISRSSATLDMTALTRTNRLCVSRAIASASKFCRCRRAVEEQRTESILRDERGAASGLENVLLADDLAEFGAAASARRAVGWRVSQQTQAHRRRRSRAGQEQASEKTTNEH